VGKEEDADRRRRVRTYYEMIYKGSYKNLQTTDVVIIKRHSTHAGYWLMASAQHYAPPDPLAGFKGPTSKGREGKVRRGREEAEREGPSCLSG